MTVRPAGSAWLPYGFVVLAVLAVLLVFWALRGRRPVADLPDRDGYFAAWATVHGGYDPRGTGLVGWWLSGVYVIARPLARAGVSPSVLTSFGVVVAGLVPCVTVVGPRWPLLAGLVVALSAGLDNLDGAVAMLTSRTSAWGFLVDSLVDRVSDAAYLVAFWLLGCAGWVCVVAGAGLVLLEYARARAGNAGMGAVEVVTVGERPTRVIIASSFLITAGIFPGHADEVAVVGALATAGVSVIGLVQLLIAARRVLAR
ncbi:CDP-alcohol phosphatidyltransferase family protein [Acidothermaceae bacterium B102]|nr:CDP-alcohol phosphatidyltransferase family protein [Acidothermaceae bacterium B102]